MERDPEMIELARPYRFTVADYHAMGEAGIFADGARVELIEGEVVEMCPIGPHHAGIVNRLTMLFARRFGDRAIVQVQNPVRLDDHSEPQPDIVLLRPRADFYASAHPTPDDTLLAIEVAESSLAFDRKVKAPLYATKGVPELWIIDVAGEAIEMYSQPQDTKGYAIIRRAQRGESIALPLPGAPEVAVEELLG